jgi:hypothetical protein
MAIVGAEEIFKKISSQIDSQFPGFVREEGPNFVAFLRAYFEYLEQNNNAVKEARTLRDNQDLDRTVDSFVDYYRKEFMINIPKNILADKRLLTKHIRDFYRSRGSEQSYRFLFRALFDKEIDIYYPGDDILRASDGRWVRETKLRVGEPFSINPRDLGGVVVRGSTSGARALVQDVTSTIASGLTIYDMIVENVTGAFLDGERVVDESGNFVTVNAQVGSLVSIDIVEGGAYHSIGDQVEIGGAGSTQAARAIVTETRNTAGAGIQATLIRGGSGYTRDNARLIVTGGDGVGFQAQIASWSREPIATTLGVDFISQVKDVRLNTGPYFVALGSNTGTVRQKLTGTVKITSGSNTVVGQGTSFTEQLSVGDLVRVKGSANTLRVHSITNAQTFVSAISATTTITVGANAFVGLAGANIYSTIGNALKFSANSYFLINAISILNPGYGYTTFPTITIVDNETSPLNISDGYGGYLGRNAQVDVSFAPGAIKTLRITSPGQNFNRFDIATIANLSKGEGPITTTIAGANVSGGATNRFVRSKRTFPGSGLPQPTGIVTYPGRYIDTKGFLSWDNRLQDNFYYQEFSYVIRVSELLEKYRDIVKRVLHPAGTKQFNEYQITSSANTIVILGASYSNFFDDTINESIAATDVVVGSTITSAAVGPETVTLTDSLPLTIISTNVGHLETFTASDSLDAVTTAVGALSDSVTAADTTTATYVSVEVNTGTESVTATDTSNASYVSVEVNTGTESVTATDTSNASYVSVTLTTGTESVTANDSVVGNNITSATYNTDSLDLRDTPLDVTYIIGGQISETVTSIDSLNATAIMIAAISEANGEITPYASTQITVYQSTQINTIVDPTLNLDDRVNRT